MSLRKWLEEKERKTRDKGYKSNLGGKEENREKERKKKSTKMKALREGNEGKPCTVIGSYS